MRRVYRRRDECQMGGAGRSWVAPGLQRLGFRVARHVHDCDLRRALQRPFVLLLRPRCFAYAAWSVRSARLGVVAPMATGVASTA